LWLRTPLLRSTSLSARCGRDVWLKLESSQPTGSFKQRGMGASCRAAVEAGATALVSSSGGNAGLAVAWAGRALGVPVTVVVPRRTSALMRQRIEAEGATVVVHGEVWDDAHAHAQTLPGALVHPFEGDACWNGHATLIEEAAEQGPRPGLVVAAVGGGGLLTGVLRGMAAVGWADVPVLAMETVGTASFAEALRAGHPVTLPGIDSIALTLGARTVCREVVSAARSHGGGVHSRTVRDDEALDAVERFLDDHRVLVEPACGAALAPVYGDGALPGDGPVLVVVCGGAAATLEALRGWRESLG
jgi:L-serine/L-threonine ammonia-lyase